MNHISLVVPNHISQLHSNHISIKLILNRVPGGLSSRDQEEAARRQQELARQFQEVGSLLLALMVIIVITDHGGIDDPCENGGDYTTILTMIINATMIMTTRLHEYSHPIFFGDNHADNDNVCFRQAEEWVIHVT